MQSVLVKQRYLVKIKRIVMVDFKIDFLKFDGFHPQACPLNFGVNGANDDARCFGRNVLLPQVSSVRSNQSRQFFLSPGRCSRIFLQLTSFFFKHLLCSTFTIAPSLPLSKNFAILRVLGLRTSAGAGIA